MKKLIIFFIPIILFFYFNSNSQIAEHTKVFEYLSISYGASIPKSDFAQKNIYNPRSGFAVSGKQIGIELGYKLKKVLGLKANARMQWFNGDKNAFNLQWCDVDRTVICESIDLDKRFAFSFLVGAYYQLNILKKVSIAPEILAGVFLMYKRDGQVWFNPNPWLEQPYTRYGLGYQLGLNLKYLVTNKWFLLAHSDINGNRLKYFNPINYLQSVDRKFLAYNLGVGLGYRFNSNKKSQ